MPFNFDTRGFETVYELSFTKRLFNTMEEQLVEVHQKTIKEKRALETSSRNNRPRKKLAKHK